ncbi:MAG: DNA repair protein RecO (recombination protein O) [Salibacteraceae bacterium]|jgi:DNA repair protein RecO (recombination protein O)
MVHNTRAIVLHKTNYSESSLVVQVYSLNLGKISLIIYGAKKKKSRNKSALFEPLSILEIAGNFSNTDKLIRPSEVKVFTPLIQIQNSIGKRLIALFLAEVVHKSIKETIPDADLYMFMERSLLYLENSVRNVANFHLVFLLELSKFLGFSPLRSNGDFFNLSEGCFTNSIPNSSVYLREDEKSIFHALLGINIDKCHELKISSAQRKLALKNILEYYKIHNIGMGEIKSHLILETIFV